MELRPIRNEGEYEQMLEWVDAQFDQKPRLDSPEGVALQVALSYIKLYEDIHYPVLS